jgi:hypothetical protein
MKSLTQHITEKLVLTNKSKIRANTGFIDDLDWNENAIKFYKDEMGLDPTKIDYANYPKANRIINAFISINKIVEFFDYICAGSPGRVTKEEWINLIETFDVDDFIEYNELDDDEFEIIRNSININEKLVLTNKSKIGKPYNPDELNDDNDEPEILYSDMEEDNADDEWDCFKEDMKYLEDKYYGFLVTQFTSLSNITVKELERKLWRNSRQLIADIIDEIVNGKAMGYEISLVGGHLEIDCINSGSRGTYYVYAFDNDENYIKMIDWAGNDISDEELYELINTKGFISEITFK